MEWEVPGTGPDDEDLRFLFLSYTQSYCPPRGTERSQDGRTGDKGSWSHGLCVTGSRKLLRERGTRSNGKDRRSISPSVIFHTSTETPP